MFKYLSASKLLKRQSARVDNVMFHLHYRVTFIVFVVCSALITAKEYFGSPIYCYAPKYPIPKNVLNTYCFIMSTYSVLKHNDSSDPTVVYPGIGPHTAEDEVRYHSYYQWVPVMLFLQALTFYFPRFLWKSFDGGLFSSILLGLDKRALDEGKIRNKCQTLTSYFMSHENMHRNWAIRFFVCELLCLVIVVGNIYLTDLYLGGLFINYGSDVFRLTRSDATGDDPMNTIFPRVAKCTFRKFGASGNIETHDSLCVLAANILNVKIYIFLWYWMMSLLCITTIWLIYRLAVLCLSSLRGSLLMWRGRLAGKKIVQAVGDRATIGDWFMLYHVGRCMHPIDFAAFLRIFSKKLIENNPPEPSAPAFENKPMLPS